MLSNRGGATGILTALLVSGVGQLLMAQDGEIWPQWRGANRDGSVVGAPWPDGLQEPSLTLQWRIELPPSYSGPVVSKDRVFVTYTRDEEFEGVSALNRKNGKEVWKTEWEGAMQVDPVGASMGSWIRATPTFDGESLFVAGMPDLLVCLDAKQGAERWRVDFPTRYGTPLPELGFACSPLVIEDGVFVQAADSFVRVDKRTGKSDWRTLVRHEKGQGEMGQGAYSSPDFAVLHGQPQLLVANIDAISGVHPTTGRVFWKRTLDSYEQGCILAPIVYGGGILTSTRASQTGYYPVMRRNDQFTITDGWKNKLVVYMSGPIVIGDFAYAHLKNGRFACIDLRDGKIKWISSRPFGRYCSMVWRKDRILALTNDGRLLLIHADPDRFVLADSRTVSVEETWGHIAIAGKDIYIRERNAIAAYRWQ
jgi:outer membrane protein assembly factor BamB